MNDLIPLYMTESSAPKAINTLSAHRMSERIIKKAKGNKEEE